DHELAQVICKKFDILTGAVLKDKRDAPRSANARNRRRRESENGPFRHPLEFLIQTCLDGLILFGLDFAVFPGLQADKEVGIVGSPDVTEQTETDHASCVLDARRVSENLLYLLRSRACALQGCRVGELHVDEEVSLVFVGEKAGGQMGTKEPRRTTRNDKQHHHYRGFANQGARRTYKAVCRALEIAVEVAKEFSERPASCFLGAEQ